MNKSILPQDVEDVKPEFETEARLIHDAMVKIYHVYQGRIRLNMEYCFKIGDMFNESRMWENSPKDMVIATYGEKVYKQWLLMARVARRWNTEQRAENIGMPWRWFLRNEPSGMRGDAAASEEKARKKYVVADECNVMEDRSVQVVVFDEKKSTIVIIPAWMVDGMGSNK